MAKTFNFSLKLSGKFWHIIGIAFSPLKKPFLKFFILPLFGKYLSLKNRAGKRASNFREKVILVFTNRYIIHIFVVLIALSVATSNIFAYETREDYGKNSLINKIIGLDNSETTEGTQVFSQSLANNYAGTNQQLTRNIFSENQQREEELDNQQNSSYFTTAQDGSALIKPDLPNTEEISGRSETKNYLVEEGDTISNIARRFAISIDTILWANNLSATSLIRPGQTLSIPPVSGVMHKILRGDTLTKIAQKYQADETKIKEFNHLDGNGSLVAGQSIMVPGGRIIYTQRPRQYATTPSTQTAKVNVGSTVATGNMIWPSSCHRISQYFKGWRHTGVDIACPWGGNIYAADSGVVSRVQYGNTGYGYNLIIDHGNGKQTLYAHLSRILVKAGERVTKGSVIGLEGSTGRSTGPHLHFEVKVSGTQVNPLSYIR